MKTILVIEDEECVRELVRVALENMGWHVIEAGEPVAGLQAARMWRPAVVLLDYILPGMSGTEVLHALKQAPETASIPVLLMSGLDANDPSLRGEDCSPAGILTKPFSLGELQRRVMELAGPAAK